MKKIFYVTILCSVMTCHAMTKKPELVTVGDLTHSIRLQPLFITYVHDMLDAERFTYPGSFAGLLQALQNGGAVNKTFLIQSHFVDQNGHVTSQVKAAVRRYEMEECCVVTWWKQLTYKPLNELRISDQCVLFKTLVDFIRQALIEMQIHYSKEFKNCVDACRDQKQSLNAGTKTVLAGYNLLEPNGTIAPNIRTVIDALVVGTTYTVLSLEDTQRCRGKLLPRVSYTSPISQPSCWLREEGSGVESDADVDDGEDTGGVFQ
jgi:hypothetical protein